MTGAFSEAGAVSTALRAVEPSFIESPLDA